VTRGKTAENVRVAICVACGGSGYIRKSVNYPGSRAGYSVECPHCDGKGYHRLIGRMARV
jgi:DnaJ-class molecular chaperone